MHSRPLLDYLAYPEGFSDPASAESGLPRHAVEPLEAKLKDAVDALEKAKAKFEKHDLIYCAKELEVSINDLR